MGKRSWIHLIISKDDYERLIQFIEKNDYKYKYNVVGFALIHGLIQLNEDLGGYIGAENKRSLIVLTQSDGSSIIDDLISNKVIEDVYKIILIDKLKESELLHSSQGVRIKNAKYLTQKRFLLYLERLEINEEYYNTSFQKELELKATGELFIRYISKIILGIFSYLNNNCNKKIDELFIDTTELFNALGSWVYGGRDAKIVYPYLKTFMENANDIKIKKFSYLLNYINYIGDDLLRILNENQRIDPNFYDTFSTSDLHDKMTGVLLMWRLGNLIIKTIELSEKKEVPILIQFFRSYDKIFDIYGKWLFTDYAISNISEPLKEFGTALDYKQEEAFNDIVKEGKIICKDISDFLKELPQNKDC